MIKDVVNILLSDEKVSNFLDGINVPVCIDPSHFGGELKDLLSQLTSSYSYMASLVSDVSYVEEVLVEKIDEQNSLLSSSIKEPYKKITEKQKLILVKREKIKHIEICGVTYNNIYLQDLTWMRCRCSYLKNRVKSILNTVEKSITVGITILSYNKNELANLKLI